MPLPPVEIELDKPRKLVFKARALIRYSRRFQPLDPLGHIAISLACLLADKERDDDPHRAKILPPYSLVADLLQAALIDEEELDARAVADLIQTYLDRGDGNTWQSLAQALIDAAVNAGLLLDPAKRKKKEESRPEEPTQATAEG